VLIDVASGRDLWYQPDPNPSYHPAQWSPDGKVLAVVAQASQPMMRSSGYQGEFWIVDDGGQVTLQTHLADLYSGIDIEKFSWSPTGQQIAFWLSVEDADHPANSFEDFHLVILDILTGRLTDHCIQNAYGDPAPLWSPDGQQLIVTNEQHQEILVEPQKGLAVRLPEIKDVVHWMSSTGPKPGLTPTTTP
jgi:Tol biopolymer transport system component